MKIKQILKSPALIIPRFAKRLIFALFSLLVVIVTGELGYIAFGYTPLDALFQTVITISTVGFGEVHSFTAGEKVFTILLIFAGVGTAAYTFSILIETLFEGYLTKQLGKRKMERQIHNMEDHVILCGWGRVGNSIANQLKQGGIRFVVIDSSEERIETCKCISICGDATEEDVLLDAGIMRAKALITALHGDAENLYVTLTARSLSPDIFIVSRTGSENAVSKLRQAGADRIVNPQNLGGTKMASLALQPQVAEFLDFVMHDGSLEFRLEQIEIPHDSNLIGESLRSARIHALTGTLVLGLRHQGGEFITNPPPEAEIAQGDVLVVIGNQNQLNSLRSIAT
ncbi:MAG: potassium channel protein [Firmicutes bacterium]|jgi:voltage-gated potassium channel|nr:potassium channel protein [Bacillota bacterium]